MDSIFRSGFPLNCPPSTSMFPSDFSSSSGPSSSSTRDTSPDSQNHHLDSHLTSTIDPSGSLLDPPQLLRMDRNPFESANSRRSKIYFDRAGNFQSHDLRQHIPNSTPRHDSRGLISANWRHSGSSMDSSSLTPPSTSAPLTNALATASPTRYGGYGTVGGPSGPGGVGTNDPSSLFPRALGQVQLGDNELDEIYAYCFDRGNGQYTRLIPADMLPPLQDIPALQQGCVGMKVLPVPRGLAPNGRSSNSERVALQPRPNPLVNNPGDPIQSHIDSIIALSPPPASQKRPKIYCDKWVHEGVCAFTQQGCKYKHEMPFDKATQHSLGLFHGLPAWWKKHQAELARQRDLVDASDQPVAVSSRDRSLSGPNRLTANPWRRIPSVGPNPIQYSSPFGPIGPPPRKPADESSPDRLTRGIADMNPFSMLRHVDENGDDDNEEGVRLA